jgi:phosphoglycerol transferase MdoB-like AlkP superfamily enzyme
VYGKFSWYPLRWSEAFFVADPYVNALALNPVLYFFDTYGNQSLGFDEQAVREHYDEVAAYLGVERPDRATLNFERRVRPRGLTSERYNVVLIHLESFASRYTGIFGNGTKPTPHFDAIARNGVLFPNYYVPSPGTARSVFAAFTGLPDVMSQGSTSTRNPQLVEQHVILSEFPGYRPFYFLGGSASWGNIRGLLARNIPGIRIYEEGSYASPRADGWGISDLDLFIEAHQVLRQAGQEPFFAFIQTAGNHRPYTIPDNHGAFENVQVDEATWKRWGFTSLEELNALRFIDYSLGHFFELARQEPYFQRTIFMLYGDHGIPGGGEHVTPAQSKLILPAYHVPFVIYAPGLFPQGRVDERMASEVDMLPTAAGILGIPYRYTGMGRDLFDPRLDHPRYAFTVLMDYPPLIGLLDQRYYLRMDEARGVHLYDYRAQDAAVSDLVDWDPERAARMRRLADGLWHTARYLLHHNKAKSPAGG